MEFHSQKNNTKHRFSIIRIVFFFSIIVIGVVLFNPKIDISDSKNYYEKNTTEIVDLVKTYNQLRDKQRFGFGFLDNDYSNYLAQIYSDTVRYVFKNDVKTDQLFEEVRNSNLTKTDIEIIGKKLKKAKAIWIDTEYIYLSGKPQKGTVISFKAQIINTPFTPTRFYTLLFMDKQDDIQLSAEKLEKYNIYQIAPGVYQKISNQFR